MASIGIHASHEQVAPSALLTAMREAETAGFERAWSSDHFSPWSERQGVFSPPLCWDLATVEHVDEAARHVRPEDVRGAVLGEHVLPRL